jgi:hypothetical protein
MQRTSPARGKIKRILQRLRTGALIVLFLLVPFAGAFHPKLRRRQDPDDKEIGAEK